MAKALVHAAMRPDELLQLEEVLKEELASRNIGDAGAQNAARPKPGSSRYPLPGRQGGDAHLRIAPTRAANQNQAKTTLQETS